MYDSVSACMWSFEKIVKRLEKIIVKRKAEKVKLAKAQEMLAVKQKAAEVEIERANIGIKKLKEFLV